MSLTTKGRLCLKCASSTMYLHRHGSCSSFLEEVSPPLEKAFSVLSVLGGAEFDNIAPEDR